MNNYEQYLSIKNKYDDQIKVDIDRTFTTNIYFKNKDNLQKLQRLLHAIACHKPKVGYIQGMNFLAGFLLLIHDDEKISFEIFNKLLEDPKYGLDGLYTDSFPKLYLATYQIIKLCKKYIPEVYRHFQKFNVKPQHWLSSWLLTLFLKYIEDIGLDNYKILFNFFEKYGWDILLTFVIAVLKMNKHNII